MKPRSLVSAALLGLLALTPIQAHAAFTSIFASWTGNIAAPPFNNNSAFVTMTADINLSNPAFDAGPNGGKLHSWWFSSGAFTNVTVTVTGSSNPAANGVFNTASFNWIRVFSNSGASDTALLDPTNLIDLGASGTGLAPSDAGSAGVMQVGSGGAGGNEYVSSLGGSAVSAPEPGTMTLLALGTLVIVRRRRK